MKTIITHDPSETAAVGECLARSFTGGEVVLLYGDLGAGKTAFVGGMARALGISARVTSPTFTILNSYLSGRLPLYHFDLYRIQDPEELFELGWDDALASGGVVAVEWVERAGEEVPHDAITVTIRYRGDRERIITIDDREE